jgi:microcystin degradation protein MlrC
MPKKESLDGARSVNRSQAIRDVFAENPHTDTKAVITRLAEKGVKVSPTMVYYIRSKQRLARKKAKRARVAESSRKTGATNPVELVLRVKDMAREVGGIRNLKQLVDLLAE